LFAEQNLRRQLLTSDFTKPVRGSRRAALDDLFRQRILIPGIVGTRLFNSSGTITYAARHQLIGTKVPYLADVGGVFPGVPKRRVTRTVSWRGQKNVKVLQSLIPVRQAGSMKPIGALELDQDYRAVAVTVGEARNRLVLILGIALLVLYLALFPILRRVTGELASRNRRLREHALERGSLLEAERAARAEAESIQRLLADQNERLRELDQMKDEFVSLVSHELRTPLTSIRGYLELFRDNGDLTPKQREFLKVVDRNSQRLLELVGDLLFLAKIDAGAFEIDLDEVDLAQVVEESIEACRPMAESRKIELVASVGNPPPLVGDRARLAQVLDNLASESSQPIYWAGPKHGTYELTRTADGRTYIRYLPSADKVGDRTPNYLTVGTYPTKQAFSALRRAAARDGAVSANVDHGGLLVFNNSAPKSVYFSYPKSGYQVEVYDPSPLQARGLVLSGSIKPIG